jgi:hypothetical protein
MARAPGMEECEHQIDRLLLTFAPVLKRDAEADEIIGAVAGAQSKLQPPIAQHVAERRIVDRTHGLWGE